MGLVSALKNKKASSRPHAMHAVWGRRRPDAMLPSLAASAPRWGDRHWSHAASKNATTVPAKAWRGPGSLHQSAAGARWIGAIECPRHIWWQMVVPGF